MSDVRLTPPPLSLSPFWISHAALACYKTMVASNIPLLKHWEYTGQAKIALQISSEEDLLLLEATAQSLNLCARSIQDAGRTQIAAGSRTVLGIGPGEWNVAPRFFLIIKLIKRFYSLHLSSCSTDQRGMFCASSHFVNRTQQTDSEHHSVRSLVI